MKNRIRLKLNIEPHAKGRPKTAFKNGKVWTFTPTRTQEAERELIALIIKHKDKCFPPHFPVRLTVTFYRSRPRYTPDEEMPVRKPDLDNLEKFFNDAINEILVFEDAQITKTIASKRWAGGGNWRVPGYIEVEMVKDKLTRKEQKERDWWLANKRAISNQNRKPKKKKRKQVLTSVL